MSDRESRDVRCQDAGIELGDIEQGIEQFVHGVDGGIDPGDEPRALGRIGLVAQLRREQVERVERLAQVVAGHREKARFGEVGALDLAVALRQLAVAFGQRHAKPQRFHERVLDEAREVDEQEEGDDGRQRNPPVERITLLPVADHGRRDERRDEGKVGGQIDGERHQPHTRRRAAS